MEKDKTIDAEFEVVETEAKADVEETKPEEVAEMDENGMYEGGNRTKNTEEVNKMEKSTSNTNGNSKNLIAAGIIAAALIVCMFMYTSVQRPVAQQAVTPEPAATEVAAESAEIEALKAQISAMQESIEAVKQQASLETLRAIEPLVNKELESSGKKLDLSGVAIAATPAEAAPTTTTPTVSNNAVATPQTGEGISYTTVREYRRGKFFERRVSLPVEGIPFCLDGWQTVEDLLIAGMEITMLDIANPYAASIYKGPDGQVPSKVHLADGIFLDHTKKCAVGTLVMIYSDGREVRTPNYEYRGIVYAVQGVFRYDDILVGKTAAIDYVQRGHRPEGFVVPKGELFTVFVNDNVEGVIERGLQGNEKNSPLFIARSPENDNKNMTASVFTN